MAAILSVVSVMIFGTMASRLVHLVKGNLHLTALKDAELVNQRALTLASFLVSTNLVLCKPEGWSSIDSRKPKCVWGGQYQKPAVEPPDLQLHSIQYRKDGSTTLTYSAKIDVEDAKATNTTISFSLEDLSKSPDLRKVVGDNAEYAAASDVDKDPFLVVIKVETEYASDKVATLLGGIRRPITSPRLELEAQTACALACIGGVTENPFVECRGPQEIPKNSQSAVPVNIYNGGPGAIFSLQVRRHTRFVDKYYGNRPDEVVFLRMLGGDGLDEVLLPGDTRQVTTSVECVAPTQLPAAVKYGSGPPSVDVHSIPTAYYSMDIAVSAKGVDPKRPNTEVNLIDPARIMLPSSVDATTVQEQTRVTYYISVPPH